MLVLSSLLNLFKPNKNILSNALNWSFCFVFNIKQMLYWYVNTVTLVFLIQHVIYILCPWLGLLFKKSTAKSIESLFGAWYFFKHHKHNQYVVVPVDKQHYCHLKEILPSMSFVMQIGWDSILENSRYIRSLPEMKFSPIIREFSSLPVSILKTKNLIFSYLYWVPSIHVKVYSSCL